MRAGAKAPKPADEREGRQAGGERERAPKCPSLQANAKARCRPCARESHGSRRRAFCLRVISRKESGPDISARPAYIRGANDRIRTGDLRFTRALLYQLSHVGTRLLAKREYELYRRACRFARGKCNFSGERAGIRRFSTGSHFSVATLESRMGAHPAAAAVTPESRRGRSLEPRPSRPRAISAHSFAGYSSSSGAFTTSTGTWASRST